MHSGPRCMSALGHKQTSRHVRVMCVIPLKADIHQRGLHVCFVPLSGLSRWHPWPEETRRLYPQFTASLRTWCQSAPKKKSGAVTILRRRAFICHR